MKLIYSIASKDTDTIIERLEGLSLAHTLVVDPTIQETQIVDGSKSYIGVEKINVYIDQLDREKEQWYYCNC